MSNLKEIELASKKYIFVEIPDNAHSFWEKLSYEGGYWLAMFEPRIEPYLALQSVRILGKSDDRFKIISTTKDITEEQAKNIVEFKCIKNQPLIVGREYWYKNYKNVRRGWDFTFFTAKESLQSLIQNLELDINKNYLILQKL